MPFERDATEELIEASEAVLLGGKHDGPCSNFPGQPPQNYTPYDACHFHLQEAERRKERVRRAIEIIQEERAREEGVKDGT